MWTTKTTAGVATKLIVEVTAKVIVEVTAKVIIEVTVEMTMSDLGSLEVLVIIHHIIISSFF
jgi:hypothetical protein